VKSRLPSGAKVNRRKNDVRVSLKYIGAFRTPSVPMLFMLGEFGITAGNGMDGAGEADLRIEGEEPNEERRLCDVGGGCIVGNAKDCGVPGIEGTGEPIPRVASPTNEARPPKSGGAGLFEDTRRAGKSILVTLLCCASENWPSLFFNV
jgi:hypothetical protein